ncbi:MAG TPA: hypothetical protein VJL83_05815 [Patescibacteria group bacterium]|nr:hypothetical protein [Patescibacteria group bacterium]
MKHAQTIFIYVGITALVLLDLAALDDITTGNEPDMTGEYAILIFSTFVFGILSSRLVRKRK